jgi:FAD/FMN-containing dehydrogenase
MTSADMLESLRPGFRGPLVIPGDADYDAARAVWNAMVDKRPSVVARCTGSADVVAAVNFARERGLGAAVRGAHIAPRAREPATTASSSTCRS